MKSLSFALALLLVPLAASAEQRVIVIPAAGAEPAPTLMRIRPPRDATVAVYDGAALVARVDRPASVSLRSGSSYRVVASAGAVTLWSGDIAATGGTVDVIWDDSALLPAPPPARVVVAEPPPAEAMSTPAFNALLLAIDAEFFDRDKTAVVRAAAARNRFTTGQVAQILAGFDFETEKVRAVTALRASIVDPENGHVLGRHFFFTSDRRKVRALFP